VPARSSAPSPAPAPEPHPPHAVGRAAALLPPALFAVALLFFAASLATAPFLAGLLRDYFYQTRVLALTHGLTLGWISMAMVGVLYRYVPALTKRTLPFPAVALAQAALFATGTTALVASFWTGRWTPAAWAAAALALSALLLCANLWPLLLRAPRRGVAEIGVLAATAFLVAAATLGTLLAADKQANLLGGSLITNLGAHVHLAGVGWVGLTICALSFRFLPAFLLPAVQFPEGARRLVVALAAAVVVLVAALLARSPLAPWAAFAVAATLLAYLAVLGRVVASHRMPIDWTARHAMAGGLWLLATAAAGLALAVAGAESEMGARLAVVYGVAGLLGWMSNLLIGVSYKLFPGFVAGARVESGRRRVPVGELGVPEWIQPVVFAVYNAGVLATAAGLLAGAGPLVVAGTVTLAAGGLVYAAASLRTVAWAVVDPAAPATPLRVIG
jgi:hypothetical protein